MLEIDSADTFDTVDWSFVGWDLKPVFLFQVLYSMIVLVDFIMGGFILSNWTSCAHPLIIQGHEVSNVRNPLHRGVETEPQWRATRFFERLSNSYFHVAGWLFIVRTGPIQSCRHQSIGTVRTVILQTVRMSIGLAVLVQYQGRMKHEGRLFPTLEWEHFYGVALNFP